MSGLQKKDRLLIYSICLKKERKHNLDKFKLSETVTDEVLTNSSLPLNLHDPNPTAKRS